MSDVQPTPVHPRPRPQSSGEEGIAPPSSARRQNISDPDTLKAIANPIRLALLEALLTGPLTATEAAKEIGETPTTCSFHLRMLARYGFVEETGGGKGRARPWRRISTGWTIPPESDDPDFVDSTRQAHAVMLDRYFTRARRAILGLSLETPQWRNAIIGEESMFLVTAEELAEFKEAFERMQQSFIERWAPRREGKAEAPHGARVIEVLLFGVPVQPADQAEDQ